MSEVTTKRANVNNGTKSAAASKMNVRYLTVTAMLSAIAFILMFLDFSVPVMPNFIRMDLSELPALIGAFAMGPACGVWVCLVKNLLHLFMTSTGGVGELSNFVLGVAFVLPAGLIYKHKKNKKSAITGALIGALQFPIQLFRGLSDLHQDDANGCDHRCLSGNCAIRKRIVAVPLIL